MPSISTGTTSLFYQESGSGDPVLFLPGLGADHTAWGLQIATLQRGFRCIAVDNRDCGRSDKASAPYSIRDMAADTVGLIDALGIERAHVVGWSMGGAIAQELTLARPERVRSLALVASYHERDPRAVARSALAVQIRSELGHEAFLRFAQISIFTYRAYQREGYIEGILKRGLEYPYTQSVEAYARQASATVQHESRGRLGAIAVPTLVLVGDEDILTPLERFARPMAAEIPNAHLEVIAEVGHALLWEQPEATTMALEAWLRSRG